MLQQRSYLFFCISILLEISICCGSPVRTADYLRENGFIASNSTIVIVLISVISSVCFVLFGVLCICCHKNSLLKSWIRQRQYRRNLLQSRNGCPNGNEISVFPPLDFQQNSGSTSEVYFDPLPDITPRLCKQRSDNDDWFAEPHKNFPRPQLQYVRKLGSGWFGQVLLGRAIGIDSDHTSTPMNLKVVPKFTPVVVKSLREDASLVEQSLFLQELKPYRDLRHSNVLKVLGSCLEKHPYLVLLEYCPKGDLKSFLKKESMLTDNMLIKMCQDVAAGLTHMHQQNFIHTDLAARNCLVEDNLTVKIGDYGFSIDTGSNKDEYYLAENVALPIRWSPPETLKCTDTTIEAIPLTKEANIWSLGVVIWEIMTRGDLPYGDLDEDCVIQQVILDGTRRLQIPTSSAQSKKLSNLLNKCWLVNTQRPTAPYINSLLAQFLDVDDLIDTAYVNDFEKRWHQLSKPEHVQGKLSTSDLGDLKLDSEFNVEMSSPTPSLKNLHGSAEDLDARVAAKFGSAIPSWLGLGPDQVMDSLTEEITDAIQRLDEALADEKSEPSSSVASPEKNASANFILGKDSLVNNPPGVALHRSLSDREEDNLTMRLEMSEFSELVRLKSQSVQDFMRLTVVDDGSDSDKTSQPGSLVGDFNSLNLIPEKNFSSEGNLKEAVRDVDFLVELERYQAEHKFSIISEASRDGMTSIEYFKHFSEMPETDSQSAPSDDNIDTGNFAPFKTTNMLFDVNEVSPDSKDVLILAKDPSNIRFVKDATLNHKDASPDCIPSIKGSTICSSLPDIISHDTTRKFIYMSSSSLEDETNESFTESEDKSKTDESESPSDIFPPKEAVINSLYSEFDYEESNNVVNFHSLKKQSSLIEDEDLVIPLQSNSVSPERSSDYSPQQVIEGEEVIFGALEDYSLDFFKSAKSSVVNDIDKNSENIGLCKAVDIQSLLINHVSDVNIAENYQVGCCYSTIDNKINGSEALLNNEYLCVSETDSVKSVACNDRFDSGNSSLNTSQYIQDFDIKNDCDLQPENLNDNFERNICEKKPLDIQEFEKKIDWDLQPEKLNGNIGSKICEKKPVTVCISATNDKHNDENDLAITKNKVKDIQFDKQKESENDVFWEQQMSAWQEAAAETRELLMQAAKKELELTLLQDFEDDIDQNISTSHTPVSDGESPKSPFSSTDRLDTDEEGTYVSYAADDEALRYSPEEINALRSELCLLLDDSSEPSMQEDEESLNDLIYINYRGSRSTLSPIKEECYDSDMLDVCNITEDDDNSSVEFTEGAHSEENTYKMHDPSFWMSPFSALSENSSLASTPLHNNNIVENPAFDLSPEDAKDSLILEDLESEGSPATSQVIVGPIKQEESGEDILVVDTETHKVTLVDSGRPQSTIAFLIEKEDEHIGDSQERNIVFDTEDDVAQESLPYESSRSQFNSLSFPPMQEETVQSQVSQDSNDSFVKNNDMPHYHKFFTSGLSSLNFPTSSMDGNDIGPLVDSVDHVSLPYDVNFLSPYENHSPETKVALDVQPSNSFVDCKKKYSVESDNEALILDDSKTDLEPEKEFVTLSFLGRLYNNEHMENELLESSDATVKKDEDSKTDVPDNSLSSNYFSSKSEIDQSDNVSDSEVDEDFIPESEKNEETPIRTPNHLVDFVYRVEKDSDDPRYTPDWENGSDSENNDDFESSSTSGEFIWQPGDSHASTAAMCQPALYVSETITDIQRVSDSEEDPDAVDYEDESESGEEDFTPSIWNNQLTPQRSLIKVTLTNSGDKKSVHWKRQRHHRVYEYPPEPLSWHAEAPSNHNSRRTWKTQSLDYLTLADWEIGGDDFLGDDTEDFEEYYAPRHGSYSSSRIYNFAPVSSGQQVDDFLGDKCEFYIGSPGSPFSFSRSSFAPSEFFQNKSVSSSEAINYDYLYHNDDEKDDARDQNEGESLDDNEAERPFNSESKLSREKLRLDLPTLCLAEDSYKSYDNDDEILSSANSL